MTPEDRPSTLRWPNGAKAPRPFCEGEYARRLAGGRPWRRTVGHKLVDTDWRRDNCRRAIDELVGATPRLGVEADHLTLAQRDSLLDGHGRARARSTSRRR